MKLISACLVGMCTNLHGESNSHPLFEKLLREGKVIPFCPEQLGGLPTPRPASEIVGGDGEKVLEGKSRVIAKDGRDVTENFLCGARETLKLAQAVHADEAILQERSPSCGVHFAHDGDFGGNVIVGKGVTAALLEQEGFRVTSDEDYLMKSKLP
ncbi:MAG: DUF523 domain-containing protein [bacterium]